MPDRTPHRFDFDNPPPPPDWIIPGVLARGRVTLMSGDSRAGESMLAQAATVAAIVGKTWLGREVKTDRVLYLDQENPTDEIDRRLFELGMRNEHRDKLLCYDRDTDPLLNLLDSGDADWLAERTREHRAGLVIVDTITACSESDLLSQADAVRFYRAARLAARQGAAVWLQGHVRKPGEGAGPKDPSHSVMGARSWFGQADIHWAVTAEDRRVTSSTLPNGNTTNSYRLLLTNEKQRAGANGEDMAVLIESEHAKQTDPALWMDVRLLDGAPAPTKDERGAIAIRQLLTEEGTLKRGAIEQRTGLRGGSLTRAPNLAVERFGVEGTEPGGSYRALVENL